MDNRPNSIQHLFDMLKDRPSLKDKIFLKDDKLTIVFGEHYKLDVILYNGFRTYINNEFDSDIEDQDIVDLLIELAEDVHYVVEKKHIKSKDYAAFLIAKDSNF